MNLTKFVSTRQTRPCVWLAAVAVAGLVFVVWPAEVRAASLSGRVSLGGGVISDSAGIAEIAPGENVIVSLILSLGVGEDASVFEGIFDLAALGLTVTSDTASVTSGGWASVAENSSGGQSTWSDLSNPLSGERLVAQWLVDASVSSAGDSVAFLLGAGTFAGTDLLVAPFFELIPITTLEGTLLAQVLVVPEPGTATLVAFGLVVFGLRERRRCHQI